ADQSVDVFVSFETLEHVPDPERIISEVKRVLKPGGTFIGSVPNLWCDETGNDPSPFHFIVFDLPKLVSVVSLGL
ncbi:class I SAM-dependent methyltransferase, partial [Escherichia coli]|uniref:class I SAM-dependent methyltransferase n=1 Tax=Escherichia coli TaxID=562 RepID=UPI003CE44E39